MTIHPDAKIHSDAKVHPQAIVEKGAIIGAGVEVGPWSYIGEGVEIGEGSQILSHVVVKGDTLYSIAREHDLTVDELKELNKLNSNNLSVGQELIVSE